MKSINRSSVWIASNALLAAALLSGPGVASAGLSEKAPKGVVLDGTWNLDASKSDDADAAVTHARENMKSSRSSGSDSRGAGSSGGGRHGGMGGGGRHGHQNASTDDSTNSTASDHDAPTDGHGHSHGDILTDLAKNPDKLSLADKDGSMTISTDTAGLACDAGGKSALEDELGDAERACGWDGHAWVVETNRGRAGTRSDRYELSKDGKTLTYTTLVSGGRFPKVKLTRVYRLVSPKQP